MANTTLLLGHVMSLGEIEDVVLAEKFFAKSDFAKGNTKPWQGSWAEFSQLFLPARSPYNNL